ncbi:MAG: diguanylate cyclase [Actinomycetota bacterium]|nr:diguanylate cyclase [Actinomycetota bacterium]
MTINPGEAAAIPPEIEFDFSRLFNEHGAVMLLIDPLTGNIVYSNNAAQSFYGYSKQQLQDMKISQINTLPLKETEAEMKAALEEERNFFVFKHRLSNEEIRTVEVFSYPINLEGKDYLFSIVHDINDKTLLAQRNLIMRIIIYSAGSIIIIALLSLISLLVINRRKIKKSEYESENFNLLLKTFMDADGRIAYLKDEEFKFVFVNKAFEEFYNKKSIEVIGKDELEISDREFVEKRKKTGLKALRLKNIVSEEFEWKNRIYKATKFPVKMLNGAYGIGAYIGDITEERLNERAQKKILQRHMILTDVLSRSFESTQKQLDYVLHKAIELTESVFGYIYLYDEEKQEFTLNSWSIGVMDECKVIDKQTKYQLEKTGIWGEAVRQRKPIIVNDFLKPNPLKKGYPQGHVHIDRFMTAPVIIDNKIVAVVGFANKKTDYSENDVYEIILLMNGAWNAVNRREMQESLAYERKKYLQTLISIGDGIVVVGEDRNIEMINPVAQKLTGWTFEEARGKNYKDVLKLVPENPNHILDDPIENAFIKESVQELDSNALLLSKDGKKYFLEDSSAPIKDYNDKTIGVVLVFRDATEKREQQKKIEYLSFHDSLTGLYNRRFFEEEIKRLDTERNLPLSIIMGDLNGLKLTNDIFGHEAGDLLLKSFTEVIKKVCRNDDIIARWGGDEFVFLLPKTGIKEAKNIIRRLKKEFEQKQVIAIKGSISMGLDTKDNASQNIEQILDNAEEKMYSEKTIEREAGQKDIINNIIEIFHKKNEREKEHSENVAELCQKMAKKLNFTEEETRKLKNAAYFHDIGKIVLDPELLDKQNKLSFEELNEIKRHPVISYRILNSFDGTLELAEIVLSHHERWDGAGYPKGLKKEEAPLLSRIISIAEAYEWILYKYRDSDIKDKSEAIKELKKNSGTQFDPCLIEAFLEIIQPDI